MQFAQPAVAAYPLIHWQCLSGWLASRAASSNSNLTTEIAAYRSRLHNEGRSLNGPYPAPEDLPPSPAGISRTLHACARTDVGPARLSHYCCLLWVSKRWESLQLTRFCRQALEPSGHMSWTDSGRLKSCASLCLQHLDQALQLRPVLAGLRSDLHLQDIPLILSRPLLYPHNELEAGSWEVPTQHTLSSDQIRLVRTSS